MHTLKTPLVTAVPILKRHAKALETLGLRSVGDLIHHFPFRYEDYSRTVAVKELRVGVPATIKVKVEKMGARRSFYGPRRAIIEGVLTDASGSVRAMWFGQYYLPTSFPVGTEVWVAGTPRRVKGGLLLASPTIEPVRGQQVHTGRIVPIYSTSGKLTVKHLRYAMEQVLPAAEHLKEWLPDELRERFVLPDVGDAVCTLHFPESFEALVGAQERVAVEELFLAILRSVRARNELAQSRAPAVPFPEEDIRSFVHNLPYEITDGQRRAAWAVVQDLSRPQPMHRLLNGDVGSGKTTVAAIAARAVIASGGQVAVLAPTEILASQHFASFVKLFASLPVEIALLTGARAERASKGAAHPLLEGKARRNLVAAAVADGTAQVVIGTHALLEDGVAFSNLELTIVDEQHRFGVRQRQALHRKRTDDALPHLLSLTATPIPRSLALAICGDVDVSVLSERPHGRPLPVTEVVVGDAGRLKAERLLGETIALKHQAFVVCPAVKEGEEEGTRTVEAEAKRLSKAHPEWRVGVLHGQMPSAKKQAVLEEMRDGTIGVLVASTVIEVGIDFPNATVMVIESAERFGLAQLHQLRGRVGRGDVPGRCLLLTEQEAPEAIERLKAVVESADGFALAEKDLQLRGPGELYGTAQSGAQSLAWSSGRMDMKKIAALQDVAQRLLKADPALSHDSPLKARLQQFEDSVHLE